jgi:LAS superfamily LD-carboxypeptidase LdcB
MKGEMNGILDKSLLRDIKPTGQLHHIAARCWHAMRSAAWKDGIQLSLSQGYRTYKEQEMLFRSRYTTNVLPGRPTKRWNGELWYQKPKTAMAATPGTSNHGWALALDLAIDADGDEAFEWPVKSLDKKAVDWLLKNADKFGFSWELQSEPWHLVYVAGDKIPKAVLVFEAAQQDKPPVVGS